jgi:hypothetical protein
MIRIEDLLVENLPNGSEFDGHDAGSGEVNLFIRTDSPKEVFEAIKSLLRNEDLWTQARVAFRRLDGEDYTILWPASLRTFGVT